MTRRVTFASLGLPILSAALFAGYLVVVQDRLPAEVAIHWGPSGTPDGFMPRGGLPVLFLGLAVMVIGLMAAVCRDATRSIAGRPALGLANGVVWFLGALFTISAAGQIDQAVPPSLPGWSIALAVVAGLAGGWVAMIAAGPSAPVAVTVDGGPADAERFDLAEGHTAVWSGITPFALAPVVLGGAILALGVVLGVVASWWLLTVLVPVAALLFAASSFRVTVGRGMIGVSGRVFGFPKVAVPLSAVERVDAGKVDAWEFGGWGIRIGVEGETAVITRSGPALVVTRTDGARLRVSLNEPQEAAAVATTLLDRRR